MIIHSDQGSQYSSDKWNRFCASHGLVPSMSRRVNCYDNAAVESFFSSLKKEKIRLYIFKTREEARAEIIDEIADLYKKLPDTIKLLFKHQFLVTTQQKYKIGPEQM